MIAEKWWVQIEQWKKRGNNWSNNKWKVKMRRRKRQNWEKRRKGGEKKVREKSVNKIR